MIAGKTAGVNWLSFLEETHVHGLKKSFLLKFEIKKEFFFFKLLRQRHGHIS